ncbi:MAG: thiamine-phosphate kinase [Caulobacterales bacterium]
MSETPDEFDWIAALRPLTRGAPAALGLLDDAAILPSRPGFDLVVSKDAMVEGVHFLAGEAADVVARRLLRTNLSDLAAKAAEPFGYFLMTAWPAARGWSDREAFIRGLKIDGEGFDLDLLGGDTVATPGPLTVSATVLGWVPSGRAVLRSGAKAGEALVVLGWVGDGFLGWRAALGEIADPTGALAAHFRLPEPLLALRGALRAGASAAADVSDGLMADAMHIAQASGLGVSLALDRLPLSPAAAGWLDAQRDRRAALLRLARGGDDYALVCAAPDGEALVSAARAAGVTASVAGVFTPSSGLAVTLDGAPVEAGELGWRHA